MEELQKMKLKEKTLEFIKRKEKLNHIVLLFDGDELMMDTETGGVKTIDLKLVFASFAMENPTFANVMALGLNKGIAAHLSQNMNTAHLMMPDEIKDLSELGKRIKANPNYERDRLEGQRIREQLRKGEHPRQKELNKE